MTDKHTPGPWLVLDYTDTNEPAWHIVPSDFCGTIATIHLKQKADARLIAAAPDLLAALEAMRDNPTIAAVCPSPLWAKMINAIEKAKGTV